MKGTEFENIETLSRVLSEGLLQQRRAYYLAIHVWFFFHLEELLIWKAILDLKVI